MKLTKYEKAERKNYKKFFGKALELATEGRVTFAVVRTGPNRGKIAWSICSPDEKMHRKYGEYVALRRMYADNYMPVEFSEDQKIDPSDLAYQIQLDNASTRLFNM